MSVHSPEVHSQEIDAATADIRIDQGQWVPTYNGESIGTEGLGPCIGLAVFNRRTRAGYMAHTVGFVTTAVDEMLDKIAAETEDRTDLLAWPAGGETSVAREETLEAREHTLQSLAELGIPPENIKEEWGENPDEMIHMVLDTTTGQCYVTREDASDTATYLEPQHVFDDYDGYE